MQTEAPVMALSFERKIEAAERITDAADRAAAFQDLRPELEAFRRRISEGRALACWEANRADKVSLRKLAERLGVSYPLVQHQVEEGEKLSKARKRK